MLSFAASRGARVRKQCEAPQTLRRAKPRRDTPSSLDRDLEFSEHWLVSATISYSYRHRSSANRPTIRAARSDGRYKECGMENAGSARMLRLTGAHSSAKRPSLSHLETL